MKNFSPEFKTPEQYITDITYKIWEERGIGRIRDWYAADGPVRTPHGVTTSVEIVVQGTLETLHEFPDRQLLPEDIIIGDTAEGFLPPTEYVQPQPIQGTVFSAQPPIDPL